MNGIRRIRNRSCFGKGGTLFRSRLRCKSVDDSWF